MYGGIIYHIRRGINEEGDKEVGNHYVEEDIGPLTTKSKGRQPEHWNNKKQASWLRHQAAFVLVTIQIASQLRSERQILILIINASKIANANNDAPVGHIIIS